MALPQLFEDLADTVEAMARTLREIAAEIGADEVDEDPLPAPKPGSALERALALHPMMGRRQRELIPLVEREGKRGADTGVLSRTMGYDQPNVYLTLQNLIRRGFIEKDTSQHPHRYFIGPALRDESGK